MRGRGQVLFIGCHLPYPPLSGGRRRELELIRRISRHFDIHLAVVSKTYEQDLANAGELARFCHRVDVFPAEPPVGDTTRSGDPPQVLRHRSPALSAHVAELLARDAIDLIHVEGYYLMQHVPEQTRVPVLLGEQNIEYDLDRQRAAARRRAHDLRTYRAELAAWRRADALAVLTPEDRDMLLGALPGARVRLVPDGADHIAAAGGANGAQARPDDSLIVFLANFGYEPNVDAALHLCDDILPRVRARMPGVHLWLVGTDPPPEVVALGDERTRVTGRVPDVAPYVDAADVVVCPLRVGGGVKVKAIEALRRGKCVVSSSVGAQGLPPAAREAIAVADAPDRFARAVVALLSDRARREQVERRSARAGRLLPTWGTAAQALMAAYDELLADSAAALRSVS